MGVKGLNFYITHCQPGSTDIVNICEEINNWTSDHGGEQPIVLIDLKEVANMFSSNETGIVFGGRFDYYNKLFKAFFDTLGKTNAKFVFFMAGKKLTDDLPIFIPKVEQDYISSLNILEKAMDHFNEKCEDKNKKLLLNTRMPLSYDYNLFKMAHRYGEVHVNFVRHNQEIASYAKQHADKVLAILTSDTDFVVFGGDYQYWLAHRKDHRKMTCKRYNTKKIIENLGLSKPQMPLLSALSGSKYLPNYVLEDFLKNLAEVGHSEKERKIPIVAAYVKKQPMQIVNGKPVFDLKSISRDVFGDGYTMEQLNFIENGIICYDLDIGELKRDLEKKENSFLKFCKKHAPFLFKLATDDVFNIKDISYLDLSVTRGYAELIIPLLMKMNGVLYKDNKRRPDVRQICMKHDHDEPCKVTEEAIIYPPMQLPPLFDLVFKNKESQFDEIRLSLLAWTLNLDVGFVQKVSGISSRFSAVILTLQYLIQNGQLTSNEANVILYTENQVRNASPAKFNRTTFPVNMNANFVQVAHLYVKMYILISQCIDVCGLRKMADLLLFNAVKFHSNMDDIANGGERQMKSVKSAIEGIWFFS